MSDDALNKLAKKIDDGFARTDKKSAGHDTLFEKIFEKLDKHDEQFTKIVEKFDKHDQTFDRFFKHMEKRFDEFDKKLEQTASQESLDRLTVTIDSFVKRLDTQEIEQASRDAQFDRLLEWARKVSKKTGIPLENL